MPAIIVILLLIVYYLGYRYYSGWLARKVFGLRPDVQTPAHVYNDGSDYVPTRPFVLFGHHYASIAGLAPMLGPALAVIWGWLPGMLWVVFGALLVGCVHDLGSLVLSVRSGGKSIGQVAEGIITPRSKTLFHLIIFFLVSLAMGVFVFVIAKLFTPASSAAQAGMHFPQATVPTAGLMLIAMAIGFLVHRRGLNQNYAVLGGFGLVLILTLVASGPEFNKTFVLAQPETAPSLSSWMIILLGYALAASVLPVWLLLQPRDFLNSLLLYLGLTSLYIGFFASGTDFSAPAVNPAPEGAPNIFPFVFITIACGAASGFHSLVSSGTTAKQLDKETHARPIGYGGMIGESLLGLIAILATTTGITATQWKENYLSWDNANKLANKIGLFIDGCATFLETLGINPAFGATLVSVIVVSYALTSLDSATRLLRYNLEEIGESLGIKVNRYVAGLLAVAAISMFAFYKVDGKPAGLLLWHLFGTTNQLLAGLALLAITLYLLWRGRAWYVAGIPMIFLLGATLVAMVTNIAGYLAKGEWPLFVIGLILLMLAVWLIAEALLAVRRFRSLGRPIVTDLDIVPFQPGTGQGLGKTGPVGGAE